jgi:cytochrome c-type biogenesis protein CcmE
MAMWPHLRSFGTGFVPTPSKVVVMTRMRTKLLVAGAILAVAVGYLAYAGLRTGLSYFVEVDAFLADALLHAQRVRLHGKVGPNDLRVNAAGKNASFKLVGQSGVVPVSYRGQVPDLLKADGEVVVEGRLDGDGVFQADQLMSKCASKYSSQSDGRQTGRRT